jgi:hypothetical protein
MGSVTFTGEPAKRTAQSSKQTVLGGAPRNLSARRGSTATIGTVAPASFARIPALAPEESMVQRQGDDGDGGVTSADPATTTDTTPPSQTDQGPQQNMAPKPSLGEPVRLPEMNDIVKSPTVEAARQSDWEAGLKDFRERGGWIIWQGSPQDPVSGLRDDARGTYLINEWPMAVGALDDQEISDPRDAIVPGNPPANDSLNFTVGHYHQHPPLDPSLHKVPANLPVGPSQQDRDSADHLGSPGVVRDFTDTSRTTVRDYRYGPDVQVRK